MSRHLPLLAILTGVAWLIGVLFHLSDTQSLIHRQAAAALLTDHPMHASFEKVELEVSGQEVTLTGKVATDELKRTAEEVVMQRVRIPNHRGAAANPVTAVHNNIKVDSSLVARAATAPAWWAWGGAGREAWLYGEVPDEAARQRLSTAFATVWPLVKINNNLTITEGRRMPPPDKQITFPAAEAGKPWAGLAGNDIAAKSYDPSLTETGVAADFTALKLDAAALTKGWEPWRNRIANPVPDPPAPPSAPAPAPATPAAPTPRSKYGPWAPPADPVPAPPPAPAAMPAPVPATPAPTTPAATTVKPVQVKPKPAAKPVKPVKPVN